MSKINIPEAEQIRIDLSLNGMIIRKSKIIPEIKIYKNQIPKETKNLYLVLEDITFHHFPHGTELIPYIGSDVVLDDFKLTVPLSPPHGSHEYQLTVRALDGDHQILNYGKVIKKFPE